MPNNIVGSYIDQFLYQKDIIFAPYTPEQLASCVGKLRALMDDPSINDNDLKWARFFERELTTLSLRLRDVTGCLSDAPDNINIYNRSISVAIELRRVLHLTMNRFKS